MDKDFLYTLYSLGKSGDSKVIEKDVVDDSFFPYRASEITGHLVFNYEGKFYKVYFTKNYSGITFREPYEVVSKVVSYTVWKEKK